MVDIWEGSTLFSYYAVIPLRESMCALRGGAFVRGNMSLLGSVLNSKYGLSSMIVLFYFLHIRMIDNFTHRNDV